MKHTMNHTMLSTLDDILASVGLARRSGIAAPAIGSFAAGAIFGAVAALLLAPSSGDELISTLGTRIQTLRDTVKRLSAGERDGDSQDKGDRTRPGNHSKHAAAQG